MAQKKSLALNDLLNVNERLYCLETKKLVDPGPLTVLCDWDVLANDLYGWSPKTANEARYVKKAEGDGLIFVRVGKGKRLVTRASLDELLAREIIESINDGKTHAPIFPQTHSSKVRF